MKQTLGNILTEINKKTSNNNEFPVLTASRDGISLQSDYFNKQVASKDNTGYKIIKKGQFTYRAMSDTGKFYPNRLDCIDVGIVSPAYPVFMISRSDIVDSDYLKLYFKSEQFQHSIAAFAQGSTRTSVKFEKIKTVEIDLPSMDKQKEIASIISQLDALSSKCKAKMDLFDELVKARFVEMFGDLASSDCKWNAIKLVDACANPDDIKCGPFGTQLSKDEYTDSGVAVWEIPQINSAFKTAPTHFLTAEKANQLSAYSLIPGDIAMSRKGNVGKCAIFPHGYDGGIIHSDVLRIRVEQENVNPVFMMCQLHFSGAVTRQIELVSSGAIMAGVNVTKLKQIFVHIPPKDLQDQFANSVKQIDKSKFEVQKKIDLYTELLNKKMDEYFNSEAN